MSDQQQQEIPAIEEDGDNFERPAPLAPAGATTAAADDIHRLDTLEQSGRYLLSIPRYDVQSLQSCPEYKNFLDALEKLGEAHRRCVFTRNCEIRVQSESSDGEEDDGEQGAATAAGERKDIQNEMENIDHSSRGLKSPALGSVASNTTTTSGSSSNPDTSLISGMLASASIEPSDEEEDDLSSPLPPTISRHGMHQLALASRPCYSLLQHLPSDDELLRILEYLHCRHLIQMGNTCHRFHELSEQSAVQRAAAYTTLDNMGQRSPNRRRNSDDDDDQDEEEADEAGGEGDDGEDEEAQDNNPLVPVNVGVGHLFIPLGGHAEPAIPPATPRRAGGTSQGTALLPGGSAGPMHLLRAFEQAEGISPRTGPFVRMPFLGLPRRVEVSGAGDEDFNGIYFCTGCNGNGFVFTKPREPRRRVRAAAATAPEVTAASAPAVTGESADERSGQEVAAVGAEHPGRLLRCNIAKKFSDQTILWYMSKEVETLDEDSGEPSIAQVYCFWAKLMARGQGSSDEAMYPTQTSNMMRTGDQAWQGLGMMRDTAPPVLELLD